jgi:hypothetical protein
MDPPQMCRELQNSRILLAYTCLVTATQRLNRKS